MQMLFANIDNGTAIDAPVITVGSLDVGTVGTQYFYAVTSRTNTDNFVPVVCGESVYGTMILCGTLGTQKIITWGTLANVDNFVVYKGTTGTQSGTFGTWMNAYAVISGTLGTYTDTTATAVGTGSPMGSWALSYPNAVVIPQPQSYVPQFVNKIIQHDLINNGMIIYNKKDVYNASLQWEMITGTQRYDLMTAYNWRSAIRFYPNMNASSVYFDTAWVSNFDFQLLTHNINGGYSGGVTLKGITPVTQASEVV